jgi:hypothetical protein
MAVGGLVAAVVAAGVACEPVDGTLNPSTVSVTTQLAATKELDRQHADVAWLGCSGAYDSRTATAGSAAGADDIRVDCRGTTKDGKGIVVKGRVHGVVSGACVRGKLRATVGGKEWFKVSVLGNCAAAPSTSAPGSTRAPQSPTYSPPPATYPPAPGATRTVTETATVTVQPPAPDPNCSCFQGK